MEAKITTPCDMLARDLQLGDVVRTCPSDLESPFSSAVVVRIEDIKDSDMRLVHLFRPYAATSDFSYCGNRVIEYTGFEQYSIFSDRKEPVRLLQRRTNPVR